MFILPKKDEDILPFVFSPPLKALTKLVLPAQQRTALTPLLNPLKICCLQFHQQLLGSRSTRQDRQGGRRAK